MHFMRTSGPKEEPEMWRGTEAVGTENVQIVCECQLGFFSQELENSKQKS